MGPDELRDLLIEIRTKVDVVIKNQTDHEERVRALERTKWLAIGFAAAAGGLAGQFAAKIA